MSMDDRMAAIVVEGGSGPASALKAARVPVPDATGKLLIEVRAAGVNRPDLLQRQGLYPPPPGASATLGLEVAGVVARAAGRWRGGDRVCALLGGGGYAEYAACDPRHALPIPAGLSEVEAAALPETVFTVFANVFEDGRLVAGETLLVHGANSGIGVTAIQMAKAAGARVIATARGADRVAAALSLGADVAIDVLADDFGAVAREAGGADVILDMMGGDYFAGDLEALKPGGRIVFIAAQAGSTVSLPVFAIMAKRAVVTGSTLRGRNADEKARLAAAVERTVWPWIDQGRLRPPIDRVFRLDEAAAAHQYLEQGGHQGKIVLTPDRSRPAVDMA